MSIVDKMLKWWDSGLIKEDDGMTAQEAIEKIRGIVDASNLEDDYEKARQIWAVLAEIKVTLSDLVRAVAVAGEQAMQATREAYAANVEALHQADPPEIPGSPPLATVVSLDTLGPKRMTAANARPARGV